MKTIKFGILCLTLSIIFIIACTNNKSEKLNTLADSETAFNYLKGLEGKWEYQDKDGVFGWEFEVTSRGSVIVERLKVGTPAEMTTVYYLDNGILRGNHYCQYKNQPHLTAVSSETDGELHFLCNSLIGSTKSHDEIHMHGVYFKKKEAGLSVWMDILEKGEIVLKPRFELYRVD